MTQDKHNHSTHRYLYITFLRQVITMTLAWVIPYGFLYLLTVVDSLINKRQLDFQTFGSLAGILCVLSIWPLILARKRLTQETNK